MKKTIIYLFIDLFKYSLISITIAAELLLLYRGFVIPENHISFSPYVFIIGIFPSIVVFVLSRHRTRVIAAIFILLLIGTVVVFVHFNILLQYDDWIKLGMPEKPWMMYKIQ